MKLYNSGDDDLGLCFFKADSSHKYLASGKWDWHISSNFQKTKKRRIESLQVNIDDLLSQLEEKRADLARTKKLTQSELPEGDNPYY